MSNPVIRVFGSSLCLPFNLDPTIKDWPTILQDTLQIKCINLSQPGADNFFIYHSYLENLKEFKNNDIIIIGWSHYSRKSFVLDKNNQDQVSLIPQSLVYKTKTKEFIRGNNPSVNVQQWLNMQPKNRNVPYYDTWFNKYYSEYEQKCNFQSYLDSVTLTCPGKYIPFFFSKESVNDINIPSHAGFITEFIIDNNVSISPTDAHLNEKGHSMWANHILKTLV